MSTEDKALGCCSCKAVRFVIRLPVKYCVHCHCVDCRRSHGAAFVTWISVQREDFKLAGREHLKWYQCSGQARRGFCGNCGTPLFFVSTRWPGEIHLTRASLAHKVNVPPRAHIHFDKHVDWFPFEDSLPRVGGDTGVGPLPPAPRESEEGATAAAEAHPAGAGAPIGM